MEGVASVGVSFLGGVVVEGVASVAFSGGGVMGGSFSGGGVVGVSFSGGGVVGGLVAGVDLTT